jgi:hypothetical protein
VIDDLISMRAAYPPPLTEDLAGLSGNETRLQVLGTSKNLDRLAELRSLEALWVGDVNEAQFERIIPLVDPEYLMVNGVRVVDLSLLARLRRLEALEIIWDTKVSDVGFLRQLPGLRLLGISHCPKVHDIGPISSLRNLEVLDLSGGMWSTFKPETLQPLAGLDKLWGLSMTNIRVGDQSLEPVAHLKGLKLLELSNQFPTREYARLSVALPDTECTHFEPYFDFFAGSRARQVMVTGKGKPVLSLPEHQARLDRYVAQFRSMQDEFREQYTAS